MDARLMPALLSNVRTKSEKTDLAHPREACCLDASSGSKIISPFRA